MILFNFITKIKNKPLLRDEKRILTIKKHSLSFYIFSTFSPETNLSLYILYSSLLFDFTNISLFIHIVFIISRLFYKIFLYSKPKSNLLQQCFYCLHGYLFNLWGGVGCCPECCLNTIYTVIFSIFLFINIFPKANNFTVYLFSLLSPI